MKYTTKLVFLGLLFLVLLALCGCSTQPSTKMQVKEGFAGARAITLSISSDELTRTINGGSAAFDAFLEQNCPKELTWEHSGDDEYIFLLSFSSLTDYREKTASLLGRDALIQYATPSGLFTQGVRLEEDFTSKDLMAWLNRGLVSSGLSQEDPGFSPQGGVELSIGGDSYSCGEQIQLRELRYLPVDKISISTKLIGSQSFERTISFFIPQKTLDQLGGQVEGYLQQRVPEEGSGTWQDTATGKSFTVQFSADNPNQLQQSTALALDSSEAQNTLLEEQDTLFNNRVLFTEELDFSSFLSNRNGKTYVEYQFEADSTSGISDAQLWKNGSWIQAPSFVADGQFLFQDDSSLLQVQLKSRNEYQIDEVAVQTKQKEDGTFQREISLVFSGEHALQGAQTASHHFSSLSIDGLSATADAQRCIITLQGAVISLNQSLSALLGDGNEISIQRQEGFQLFHSDSVEDQMDLRQFLHQIGYSGAVTYSYTAQGNLSNLVQTDSSGSQTFRVSSGSATRQLPGDGPVTITAVQQRANGWFVFVLFLIGAAILTWILLIAFMLIRRTQRLHAKKKPACKEDFPLLDQRCSICGAQLYQGMQFCVKCGAAIDAQPEDQEEKGEKSK